jgi:hypothetical protein
VARKGPCGGPSLASTAMLGATRCSFSGGVARAHGGGPVGLRWRFFPSSLFSISFSRKTRLNFQKNNCVLRFVILSILVLFHLITVHLVFDTFLSLIFSISSMNILFNFVLNYFSLSIIVFSLFLLLGYSESGLVKLTQIGSGFFHVFFIELWFLL